MQTIDASNCVFHHLAAKFRRCAGLDLGLIGAFADATAWIIRKCTGARRPQCRFKLARRRRGGRAVGPRSRSAWRLSPNRWLSAPGTALKPAQRGRRNCPQSLDTRAAD